MHERRNRPHEFQLRVYHPGLEMFLYREDSTVCWEMLIRALGFNLSCAPQAFHFYSWSCFVNVCFSLCLPAEHTQVSLKVPTVLAVITLCLSGQPRAVSGSIFSDCLVQQFSREDRKGLPSFGSQLQFPRRASRFDIWRARRHKALRLASLGTKPFVSLFLHLQVRDTHWGCSVQLSNQCTLSRVGRQNKNPLCWIFEQSSVWGQRSPLAHRSCKQERLCCNSLFLCVGVSATALRR